MKTEFARYFQYLNNRGIGWIKKRIIRSFPLLVTILTFFTSAFTPIPQSLQETSAPSPLLLSSQPAQTNVTIRLET
ncbi:MAG: hypothetical protein ACNA8H_14820, partial [Anaerolineales bacterium]